MITFIEENNLFNPAHRCFRLGRPCISRLEAHYGHITQLLENGTKVGVLYFDF